MQERLRTSLEIAVCTSVSDDRLRVVAAQGGLWALLEAIRLLLGDWDRGKDQPKERWREGNENIPEGYWSPVASTVQSENIARLRTFLAEHEE